MAGNKTNSNSITAIFISKLNYKKTGFRNEILKLWGLPENVFFIDGTHSTCGIPEMENKEVDIIGTVDSKPIALIEIKANLNEDLQDSQAKGGQYEKTAIKNGDIKLIYVVPDGYCHSSEIPSGSRIYTFTWSQIYDLAKQFDNTGFTEQINYFVESNFYDNDILLNKGEIAMFLSPSIIESVSSLRSKMKSLMDEFLKTHKEIIKFDDFKGNGNDNLGYWYTVKKEKNEINAWIGLAEVKQLPGHSFFIYFGQTNINEKELAKFKEDDYYRESDGVDFPIINKDNTPPEFLFEETVEGQQEKFNELMEYNINRLLKILL